jgi:hypothetical protein
MLANLLIEMVPRGGIDWSALGTDTGIFSIRAEVAFTG